MAKLGKSDRIGAAAIVKLGTLASQACSLLLL